jgi:cellulose synthase/poly-beta-1,6-N-acetylglucosamine synthase-like glycosyltransferase
MPKTMLSKAALRPAADAAAAKHSRHLAVVPEDDQVATPRRRDDGLGDRQVRGEMLWSVAAIIATLAAFAAFLGSYGFAALADIHTPLDFIRAAAFLTVVTLLVYGGLVYLCARLGYMRRRSAFRHASSSELQGFAGRCNASVAILVPSYKEEPQIVWQTLLSAALQDYPHRRVVLLIDDPPSPRREEDKQTLAAMRALPGEIQRKLDQARAPFRQALEAAEERAAAGTLDPEEETHRLAALYAQAATWLESQAEAEAIGCHSDALFAEMCLREPAARFGSRAREFQRSLFQHGAYPERDRILDHYRQLDSLFAAEVTSFERKRYANLSHAPNKAMNLNSYIGLMGRHLAVCQTPDGVALCDVPADRAEFRIADSDYVLTLDADSFLAPGYTLRLIHLLEDPANANIAVAQTPYSSVLGAPTGTERVAGATTDLQYVIHQGFTAHDATYWVGANAVLRKRALEDIATTVADEQTRVEHTRYIQDRTVIEDTESSIDLVKRGWRLFNYPARLSYSATPPDFGSLVVQRRRWANGGLLILPKLLGLLVRRQARDVGALHAFMRVHYLVSIAAVNIGLVVLFLVPFPRWSANGWLPLTAIPYFLLYARDLRLAGYRRRDLPAVYALNLLLIPVNLGGVLSSLRQAVSGRGSAFKRTPKVSDRTSSPPVYIVVPLLLVAFLVFGAVWSFLHGVPIQGVASTLNALLLLYAVTRFIGWRYGWEDLRAQVRVPRLVLRLVRTLVAVVWVTCTLVAVLAILLVLVGGLSPVQAPGLAAAAGGAGAVSVLGALLGKTAVWARRRRAAAASGEIR